MELGNPSGAKLKRSLLVGRTRVESDIEKRRDGLSTEKQVLQKKEGFGVMVRSKGASRLDLGRER